MLIRRVELSLGDVALAGAWFADVLDLPRERDGQDVVVRAGAGELVLRPGGRGPGVHHLAFGVPDSAFERARDHVAARTRLVQGDGGTVFEASPSWDARSVYLHGPGEVVLELIARRRLDDAALVRRAGARSTDELPASAVVSISEVGVPSHDVLALVDDLGRALDLPAFGEPSADFAPVGDDDGLLICVADGRLWWPPLTRPNGGGALRVELEAPAGRAELSVLPGDGGTRHGLRRR